MLAKAAPTIPVGEGWRYEPKWDGFRSIIFRHGDDVELGSRNAKPLTRYFPEVVEYVQAAFPNDAVVDGELVIIGENGAVDFDLLSLRVHPAKSRVERLRTEIPALFVAFDLLAIDGGTSATNPLIYVERVCSTRSTGRAKASTSRR
jgi:ATP-dependent DNA ligase